MANQKISARTLATPPLSGSEKIPIGVVGDKAITPDMLKNFVFAALTPGNGTTPNGSAVDLGGTFTESVHFNGNHDYGMDFINMDYFSVMAESFALFTPGSEAFIQVTENIFQVFVKTHDDGEGSISFSLHEDDSNITDQRAIPKGLTYDDDYGAYYVDRTLPDWGNVKAYALAKTNAPVALTDAATIDIANPINTLSSSSATRAFTISYVGDRIEIEVTLSAASAIYIFPSSTLCKNSDGTNSGDNTCTLDGNSGDAYIIHILKVGSNYYVTAEKFGGGIIGYLYDESSWDDLSAFTQVGTKFSVVSNKIVAAEDGTASGQLSLDMPSCLDDFTMGIEIEVTASAGSTTPIVEYTKSLNPFTQAEVRGYLTGTDGTPDGVSQLVYFANGVYNADISSSPSVLVPVVGDTYRYELKWNDRIGHNFDVYKIVGGSQLLISKANSFAYPYVGYNQNTFKPTLVVAGGCIINRIYYYSASPTRGNLFVGDSLTWGAYAAQSGGTEADRFARLLGGHIHAGSGDTSAEVLLRLPEIINHIRPTKVYLMIGTNDIGFSVSLATLQANVISIVSQLQAAGITVIVMTATPRNDFDMTSYKNWVLSQYPSNSIDMFTPFLGVSYAINVAYSPDGLHLNKAGNLLAANTITASGL